MIHHKYYLLIGVLGLSTLLFLYWLRPAPATELFFSNTQVWDAAVEPLKHREQKLLPNITETISLPLPPANKSIVTQAELAQLHKLETARTLEQVNQIEAELEANTAPVAGELLTDLIHHRTRPQTSLLFSTVFYSFDGLIIYYKAHFNRVRPSLLDPTLKPAITVPGHPAYPSGHAAQAMLTTLILGDLDPERAAVYQLSAKRIARNREIAGVHYPSDSEAGFLLAKQYFEALRKSSWYQTQINQARHEWIREE